MDSLDLFVSNYINNYMKRVPFKGVIKRLLFRPGEQERTVLSGALKGLRFRFDLRQDTKQWRGIYERPLQKWLSEYVEPGSTCLIIGAATATGTFTVLMAKLAGPGGAVYAFEPSELCKRIAYHVELNKRNYALAPVKVQNYSCLATQIETPLTAQQWTI